MNPTPTPDSQPVDIDRLRELLKAATPGPWESEEHSPGGLFRNIIHLFDKPDERGFTGDHVVIEGMLEPDDADLIAALRNEAPALLDELERLLASVNQNPDHLQFFDLISERDSLRRENEELRSEIEQLKLR